MRIPRGAARRVAAASAVVAVLLASATAVTIWRYTTAIDSANRALEARASSSRTDQAITAYWHEREAINEYLLRPSPGLLDEINRERDAFGAMVKGLGRDATAERPLAARAVAG